jgi:quercetin dioxygenase-like cupin family protein
MSRTGGDVCRPHQPATARKDAPMSDHREDDAERRRNVSHLADRQQAFDLAAEVQRLKSEPTWAAGHSARTLIKYDDLRVVLIVQAAGGRIPEHKADGRVSIHVLSGHIQLQVSEQTFDLRAGGLLAMDRAVPHDVTALEESAFLLTIAWPRRD